MTPERLREIAEAATPGPWELRLELPGMGVWAGGFRLLEKGSYGTAADLSIAALAPDLARVAAGLYEAIMLVQESGTDESLAQAIVKANLSCAAFEHLGER